MLTSSSIAKIAPAILAAQRKIGGAVKDSTNPHYRAGFASLGAVIQAVKFALNDAGVSILQPIGRDEQGDYVETILLHESGEYMSDKTRLVYAKQNDPQAAGSAQSYARRYGLQSFLTLPTADDDGEAAMFRQGDNQAQDDRPSWEDQPPKSKSNMPWQDVRIHFGKHLGKPLGSLEKSSIHWCATDWKEKKRVNGATSVEDEELMAALEMWQQENK